MRSIFACIFSCFIIAGINAQVQQDSVLPALRIGFDLSNYGFYIAQKGFLSNEFSLDYSRNGKNIYALDVGFISGGVSSSDYIMKASGIYSRLGIDKNFLNHPDDVLSLGTRLGFSRYSYSPDNVIFRDPLWGDYSGGIETQKMTAVWIEAVMGIKTEILRNVYLGWSVSARVMLRNPGNVYFPEYKVPGYGSLKGSVSPGFGFFVFYRIPIKKNGSNKAYD